MNILPSYDLSLVLLQEPHIRRLAVKESTLWDNYAYTTIATNSMCDGCTEYSYDSDGPTCAVLQYFLEGTLCGTIIV